MDEDEALTVWCGNLPSEITQELLYELFLQAAPLKRVHIPTDKQGRLNNYAFITFKHKESVDYAIELLNNTKLYEKQIVIRSRSQNSNKSQATPPNFMKLIQMGSQPVGNSEDRNRGYNKRGRWNSGHHRDESHSEPKNYRYDNHRRDYHRDTPGRDGHNRSGYGRDNYAVRRRY